MWIMSMVMADYIMKVPSNVKLVLTQWKSTQFVLIDLERLKLNYTKNNVAFLDQFSKIDQCILQKKYILIKLSHDNRQWFCKKD